MYFKDRCDAGQQLAKLLSPLGRRDIVVYALPRGGVIVAAEIIKVLGCTFDLVITRKIRHPFSPEYAIGAIAEDGHSVFNEDAIEDVDKEYLKSEISVQRKEARRRRKIYLSGKKPVSCTGKIAILVDDGIATGLTMKAAIKELTFHSKPHKIVVAVPIASKKIVDELQYNKMISVVTCATPLSFDGSIGSYYKNFPQISDKKVVRILCNLQNYCQKL